MDTKAQEGRQDKLQFLHEVALGFIPDYKRVDTAPISPNDMTDWLVNMLRLECHMYATKHEKVHLETSGAVKFAMLMALIVDIELDPGPCDALTQAAFDEGLDFVTAVKAVTGVLITDLSKRIGKTTYQH